MPPAPPAYVPVSFLALDLDAFVAVRAALRAGIADARAAFECSLKAPFEHAGFIVLAGVDPLLEALERLRPKAEDLPRPQPLRPLDAPTPQRPPQSPLPPP